MNFHCSVRKFLGLMSRFIKKYEIHNLTGKYACAVGMVTGVSLTFEPLKQRHIHMPALVYFGRGLYWKQMLAGKD